MARGWRAGLAVFCLGFVVHLTLAAQPATPQPATPQPAAPQPATPQPAAPSPAGPQPATPSPAGPMQGVPPARESQVTLENYRQAPFNRWAFRNAAAPLHVVMIPREGDIRRLAGPLRPELGEFQVDLGEAAEQDFDAVFADNHANGVVVMQGSRLLHERYFGDFGPHQQHLWFSMTKSLASSVFGLLVESGHVDLAASPADYIPELRESGFARVTVQQLLDHSTAIDFQENYTDPASDFARYYAPALGMAYLPGAADASPAEAEIYGVHDFLSRFVRPDPAVAPGARFDYNSSNADVLGWLIARLSGETFQDYVQRVLWSQIGAEHDAYIAVDRAYMPVVTGGMNTTLRDAARFGMVIRDRGEYLGRRLLPAAWIDATLAVDEQLRANMAANPKYRDDPWQAYHNMWWVLDAARGEYAAVGIHGQVIYINRSSDTVMAWFSSQPTASAAGNPTFHAKLEAARQLAEYLVPGN